MKFLTWRMMRRRWERRRTGISAVRAQLQFHSLKSSIEGDGNRTPRLMHLMRGKGNSETTVNKVEQEPRFPLGGLCLQLHYFPVLNQTRFAYLNMLRPLTLKTMQTQTG